MRGYEDSTGEKERIVVNGFIRRGKRRIVGLCVLTMDF